MKMLQKLFSLERLALSAGLCTANWRLMTVNTSSLFCACFFFSRPLTFPAVVDHWITVR